MEEDLVTNVGLLLVIVAGVMAVNAHVDVDIDRTRREERRTPMWRNRYDRRRRSLFVATMVLYNIIL